ncbi:MAG TPA: hypothetical protein VIM56_16555 [Rhizomicrobium sp.]
MTSQFRLSRRQAIGALGGLAVAPAFAAPLKPEASWFKLNTIPYEGKQDDIYFVSPDTGWYGNGKGKLYATADGGESWHLICEKPGTFIRSLGFVDSTTGFLGNVGTDYAPQVKDPTPLYVTKDGGKTWVAVRNVDGPLPRGICSIDIYRGRAIYQGVLHDQVIVRAGGRVGGPAFLLESHDLGESWRSHDLNEHTAMILDVKFVSPSVGFIAGASDSDIAKSNAIVLRTDDGGLSWRRIYRSSRPSEITWKIAFPSENVGYATVQNYDDNPKVAQRVVAKTEDGGKTWRELPLTVDHAYTEFGVGFLNEKRGWVGGSSGGFETRDGGKHWRPVEMGHKINKIRILPMPDGKFRAFAIGSEVYRLDDTI